MTYIVIGICTVLLLAVIFISAKPISMGIEARRNIKDEYDDEEKIRNLNKNEIEIENLSEKNVSEEIEKLNKLRIEGALTEDEFKKAKKKLLD